MQNPTQTQNVDSQANMRIYNSARSVPADAISPIAGGPLKGKSNINPQWRIEMLTKLFGPAGQCFKIEQTARWTETVPSGETAVFCEVNLYYREDVSNEWSAPVFGQGGSTLIRRSTEWVNGVAQSVLHIDDEAYKKAYTDAISVACKALGFASDIYYAQEETKYGTFRQEAAPSATTQQAPAPAAAAPATWPWTPGLKEITPTTSNWNASVTQVSKMAGMPAAEILGRISKKFNITEENFQRLLVASNRKAA